MPSWQTQLEHSRTRPHNNLSGGDGQPSTAQGAILWISMQLDAGERMVLPNCVDKPSLNVALFDGKSLAMGKLMVLSMDLTDL